MAIQVSRFSEFASLFAEAEQNAKDLEIAHERIKTLESDRAYDNDLISNLRDRVNTLEADLAEVVRERDSFRTQYHDADSACSTLRGDLDAAQSLLSESRAEVETLKQRIVSLEARLGNAEAKAYDTQQESYYLVGRIARLRKSMDKAAEALDELDRATAWDFATTPATDWTYPDTPLPVLEVAPVPPTLDHPDSYAQPSEAPPEQPQADAAAPMEHGSSDPKLPDDGTWRSYY